MDGNFPYWCCGDLKDFGTIAVAPTFRRNRSVDASGVMDGFFLVGVPGKCMERLVCHEIRKYLDEHDVLSNAGYEICFFTWYVEYNCMSTQGL